MKFNLKEKENVLKMKRPHRNRYAQNVWILLVGFLCSSLSDTEIARTATAVDGSNPIGMVDEVAFKVIPGYAPKGRRFSHVAFKEVNIYIIKSNEYLFRAVLKRAFLGLKFCTFNRKWNVG